MNARQLAEEIVRVAHSALQAAVALPASDRSLARRLACFPAVKDDQFGNVLQTVDLAIIKADGRRPRPEPRDIADRLTVHE